MNISHFLLTALGVPACLGLVFAAPAPAAPAAPPAAADSPASPDADDADFEEADSSELTKTGDFMMHYFQHPEPEAIDGLIRRWAGFFPSTQECSAIPSTLVFFGEVFKANPERVEGWMKAVATLPEDWQEVFGWSLRYARGEEEDVTARPSMSPSVFDACWGGFMASGDPKYAEFVLRAACAPEAVSTIDLSVRTAAWSCSSFILNYPEMQEIARAWFTRADEEKRLNFALRTNAEVQQAVFGKVLLDEEQKEARRAELEERAREEAELRRKSGEFAAHYFQDPQPLGIDELLTVSARLDPEAAQVDHALLRLFFGEVFKRHSNHIMGWEAAVASMPYEWQKLLEWSIRYAHDDEPNPLDDPEPTVDKVRACAGGFMATGARRYADFLLRVASQSPVKPEAEKTDETDYLPDIAGSILVKFIEDYPEMKKMARHWAGTASEEQKQAFARRVDADTQEAVFDKLLYEEEEE